MVIAIQDLKITQIIRLRAHQRHKKLGRQILELLEQQKEGLQLFLPNNLQLLTFLDLDNILFQVLFRKRKKRCALKVQKVSSKILNFLIHLKYNLINQFLMFHQLAYIKKLEILVLSHYKEVHQVIFCFLKIIKVKHHFSLPFQGLLKKQLKVYKIIQDLASIKLHRIMKWRKIKEINLKVLLLALLKFKHFHQKLGLKIKMLLQRIKEQVNNLLFLLLVLTELMIALFPKPKKLSIISSFDF